MIVKDRRVKYLQNKIIADFEPYKDFIDNYSDFIKGVKATNTVSEVLEYNQLRFHIFYLSYQVELNQRLQEHGKSLDFFKQFVENKVYTGATEIKEVAQLEQKLINNTDYLENFLGNYIDNCANTVDPDEEEYEEACDYLEELDNDSEEESEDPFLMNGDYEEEEQDDISFEERYDDEDDQEEYNASFNDFMLEDSADEEYEEEEQVGVLFEDDDAWEEQEEYSEADQDDYIFDMDSEEAEEELEELEESFGDFFEEEEGIDEEESFGIILAEEDDSLDEEEELEEYTFNDDEEQDIPFEADEEDDIELSFSTGDIINSDDPYDSNEEDSWDFTEVEENYNSTDGLVSGYSYKERGAEENFFGQVKKEGKALSEETIFIQRRQRNEVADQRAEKAQEALNMSMKIIETPKKLLGLFGSKSKRRKR